MATLMQQIHIGLGREGYVPVAHHHADKATYTQEHEAMQASLVNSCPAHLWPKNSHKAACPRPILMTKQHQTQLAELHEALTAAITDIVERWWTDKESRFPERMPLTGKEEDLLQVSTNRNEHTCRCKRLRRRMPRGVVARRASIARHPAKVRPVSRRMATRLYD